jgi:hypothetical protein
MGPAGEAANQFLTVASAPTDTISLSAESHNGKMVSVVLPATFVTYDVFANLGSGFNCLIANRSGEAVTFSTKIGNTNGHTTLLSGGMATVVAGEDVSGTFVRWMGAPTA